MNTTNSTPDLINWTLDQLNGLYGLPEGLLVVLGCIVIGYVMRAIPKFPNQAIPAVVVLFGAIGNALMATSEPNGTPHRSWLCRQVFVGIILGFIAWRAHKSILKRLESKIPFLQEILPSGNTQFITKDGIQNALTPQTDAAKDQSDKKP